MPLIRARDVQPNIRAHGFEKGVVVTLEAMLAEHVEFRQHMRELTALVSQCIDQIDKMVIVGGAMKDQLQLIKREQSQRGEDSGEAS